MKKLIYNKKKFFIVPEDVDDLTGRQLIFLAGLLHSETTVLKASLKALRVLSGTLKFKWTFIKADVKIRCMDYIQWVFEKISITQQLIPCYRKLYGVASEFDNMTLAEFHFCEQFYAQIKETNFDNLDNLIAVLYRPAKKHYNFKLNPDGDPRVKFNSNEINYYASIIKYWPQNVKLAILMFYDGCRRKIEKDNWKLFDGSSSEASDESLGMYGIMRGLAGPKFGDLEKVEEMYLHTALLELRLLMKEEERLEAMHK